MRRIGVAVCVALIISCFGCSRVRSAGPSRLSDGNILKSSENERVYQKGYDETFRAAVDALRRIDSGSAKLVKHDAGVIVFKKPNDSGTITVHIQKLDEQTTRVGIDARNKQKFWFDGSDVETRESFFSVLDQQLVLLRPEKPVVKTDEKVESAEAGSGGEGGDHRTELLAGLRKTLDLPEGKSFLDGLSDEDLSTLNMRLRPLKESQDEAVRLQRRCAACYIDIGRLYHDSGDYDRSAEALEIALAMEPDNAVAHCNLGDIYKHLGSYTDALRELNEAKSLDPELPDTYVNLGILYDDFLGDDQKALEYYKKYLQLGGTDKQVYDWIKAIEQGS